MGERRGDIATILCWIVLGFAGLIFAIFIIVTAVDKISSYMEQKRLEKEQIEEKVEDNEEEKIDYGNKEIEKNENAGKNETSQLATVETHYNYMQGFKDGTFGPNSGISRAEIATIFSRLDSKFDENKAYHTTKYTDVSTTSWFSNYVGYCSKELIMQGYEDGTFRPNEKMKKVEFLAAVVKYVEAYYFGYTSKYDDVKGTWAEAYIGYLESNGFITGKTTTTLGVQDYITRAEVCNVINNVLDRKPNKALIDATTKKAYFSDVPTTAWYYYDVVEATTFHDISLYH